MIALSRKTCERPARLTPDDLDPLRMIVADGALDYAFVAASFHFINRISDLLDIVTELLPAPMRRFEFLRRMSVRLMGLFMTTMDLSNRQYGRTYDEVAESISPIFIASKDPQLLLMYLKPIVDLATGSTRYVMPDLIRHPVFPGFRLSPE